MESDKELSYRQYIMRETNKFHAPYSPELEFYVSVKNGDVRKINRLVKTEFTDKQGFGKLSENALQSYKYHFVVTAALIARYCIEGGMEHETAYSLSDMYILKADKCRSFTALSQIHKEMSLDYTRRMKLLYNKSSYSKAVVKCIDYIYDNLHKRIFITELAEISGVSEGYLSRLFRKETGKTLTEYIQNKKIEAAENMLKYSEYLPSEISNILAFPNQSYFIDVFKKKTGLTPKKYAARYFQKIEM